MQKHKMTELQAVNIILSNVGQAPVTNLESNNPMAQLAVGILAEVSNTFQSEGWSWNTEFEYTVVPDENNNIVLPEDVLSYDTDEYSLVDTIVRQGKIYDRRAHSFEFDKPLKMDVTWFIDFVDMPEVAKQYVTVRAANLYANRAVGATDVVKYSQQEEAQARAAVINYECEQGDFNIFSTQDLRSSGRRYMPFNAVYRY